MYIHARLPLPNITYALGEYSFEKNLVYMLLYAMQCSLSSLLCLYYTHKEDLYSKGHTFCTDQSESPDSFSRRVPMHTCESCLYISILYVTVV